MTFVLAGTGSAQVLNINLEVPKSKQKILKYGIMNKQKITSIALPKQTQQNNIQSFFYSSQKHIFEGFLNDQPQNTVYTNYNENARIIGIHNFHQDSIIVAFNNGSLAEINKQLGQQSGYIYNFNQILPAKLQPQLKKQYRKIISDNNKSFCLVGKEVLPFMFDSNKSLISWNGKNVPNDQLDLRVPVDDIGATFFKNGSSIACANATSKIRIYDVRSNKQKPSADYHLKLEKIYNHSYLTKIIVNTLNQNIFYISNDTGAVYESDIRKSMQVTGKFKNITSTVTDMKFLDNKLITSSYDCYVRSFDAQSKDILQKCYMNKQLHCLQVFSQNKKKVGQYDQQVLSQAQQQIVNPHPESKKVKKMRKRNKVNLKYLKPVNWDQVPIKQQLLQQAKQQYQQINAKDADSYLDQEKQDQKIKNQHESDSDLE